MQNNVCKVNRFKLASNPKSLREQPLYQEMRAEINRRNNPLSGGTDWAKVCRLAQELANTSGADLLTSAYYVSAASKTQGVSGLASGLELMLSIVSYCSETEAMATDKVTEIINWAVTKVIPDLKKMAATPANIRDWYRCEFACQQLFELLKQKQPQQVPNLDVLGYVIFEKLDHIEVLQRKSITKESHLGADKLKIAKKHIPWIVVLSGILFVFFACAGIYGGVSYQNEIRQQIPSLFTPIVVAKVPTVAERIDEFFNLPPQNSPLSVYPEQVDYLIVLDKNFRRFSATRSKMANLSRLSRRVPVSVRQLQEATKDVANYASSLSPILARTYFIDGLLEDQAYARADAELMQLDTLLKALLIKRTLLALQLEKLTAVEPETEIVNGIVTSNKESAKVSEKKWQE
ncbi:MAG: type VI secretion system ImpA family N-terminal domain-containing protein [Shewanella sp.]